MNQGKEPHPPAEYQPSPTYEIYEDEIDLADLVGVLYRRKWLIIVGTLLITAAAVGVSFLVDKEYKATTLLEIGQLVTNDNQNATYQPVEPAAAIKGRLNSIAKIAARDFSTANAENDGEDNIIPKPDSLKITVPEEGSTVEISATVPKNSKVLSYLSKINELFIADHNRIFERQKEKLQHEIEKLKIEKETLAVEDESLEIPILKNMQEQGEEQNFMFYSPVSKTIPELKARIEELKRTYDVRKTSLENDIQKCEHKIESLKKQQNLHPDRKEISRKIDDKKSENKLLTKKLSNLEANLQDRIQTVKMQITKLKSRQQIIDIKISNIESDLNNMFTTKVFIEPSFSDDPAAPNKKIFVAGGFAGGLFVMLFLAFAVEFFQVNRERITGKPMEKGRER